MNNLDETKTRLYDKLIYKVGEAFPDMEFKRAQGRWISPYHLTGKRSQRSKDQTYISDKSPRTIYDQNGACMSLIDFYMESRGEDFKTALHNLCDLCDVSCTLTEEEAKREQEERTKREQYKAAADNFAAALWKEENEGAKAARAYLCGRGWSDEEIKAAGFGYIDDKVKEYIGEKYKTVKGAIPKAAGDTHRLVIPYKHALQVRGFKFRTITADFQGSKYINSIGLQKGAGLFNLKAHMENNAEPVVIVEGEIDALRATIKGAVNVVATTGGAATKEQIGDAIKRGAKTFLLAFDNDERGEVFTRQTADLIVQAGARAYALQYDQGIKDADEFFNHYSVEGWKEFIKNSMTMAEWACLRLIADYEKKATAVGLTRPQRDEFISNATNLIATAPPKDKALLRRLLTSKEDTFCFRFSDLEELVKEASEKAKAERTKSAAKRALEEAERAIEAGTSDPTSAVKAAAKKINSAVKGYDYGVKFAPPTRNEIRINLCGITDGIPTGIVFHQNGNEEPLTLNPGLTFICGATGHGKTTFLNNLALTEAGRNITHKTGEKVVYFSYEIDRWRLIVDFLTTFNDDPTINESKNPQRAIIDHLKGNDRWISTGRMNDSGKTHLQHLQERENDFFTNYLQSGALTIVNGEDKAEELIRSLEYLTEREKVSVVFIDYAQLLYSEEYSRQRTEEIKKVVNDLKDFANRAKLSIVLAAQFNRQVYSPLDLDAKNIGEGGDFERIADTCLGLFNLKALKPTTDKSTDKQLKTLLQGVGVYVDEIGPIENKIFVRLLKRRYGYFPLDTVLDWDGRTKRIKDNTRPQNTSGDSLPF